MTFPPEGVHTFPDDEPLEIGVVGKEVHHTCGDPACVDPRHLLIRVPARRVEVSEIDITLLETLSEAAVRAGQLPLAVQGFALTLRLRAETGLHPKRRKEDV